MVEVQSHLKFLSATRFILIRKMISATLSTQIVAGNDQLPICFNKNKTQTAVTNICLNCIPFMNLTFRMLQHTSSEVIIIQLQINLNSKIQPYGLGTNEID